MPSTYAHYLFGKKVKAGLTGEVADIINGGGQLFNVGLHGPDILFYFKPLTSNDVNALGYAMHARPAAEFFKRARDMWQLSQNKDAAAAYLLGVVCHFALDSACHGYVEKKISVSGLAHAEIENEFDRFLIYYNGENIKDCDLTKHITVSDENAACIAPFYQNVTPKQVKKALKSIKFYNNLLIGNRAYKRFIVNFCLRVSGKYKFMKGAMIYKKPLKACADSNKRLFKLFNGAVATCPDLLNNFLGYLKGENDLDEIFNLTFGAGENWRDIPVLTVEEEDKYKI